MSLESDAKMFWSAAYFLRRAPKFKAAIALTTLKHIAKTKTGTVQRRAATILKDHQHGTDPNSTPAE